MVTTRCMCLEDQFRHDGTGRIIETVEIKRGMQAYRMKDIATGEEFEMDTHPLDCGYVRVEDTVVQ